MSLLKSFIPREKIENHRREIDRILCLPQDLRTPEDEEGLGDLVRQYTEEFRRPGGTWSLRPVQALALDTLRQNKGLIAAINVGGGKTLISALAPKVLGLAPYKTVILTRAKLIDPWMRQLKEYRQHFNVDSYVRLISYAKLSHPDEGPVLLEKFAPDLVIADEAHSLAGVDSSRRNRFAMYFEAHPETMLLAMSGTLTKTSIRDYAHLAQIALKDGSPVPQTGDLLDAFCACIDPPKFGSWPRRDQWELVSPLNEVYGDGRRLTSISELDERKSAARTAYYERFRSTPGVVHTALDTVGASIQIELIRDLPIPPKVREAMAAVDTFYELPNGDELENPLEKARAIGQLAQGVYYIWDWPGVPDLGWLDTRRNLARELRRVISAPPREIDSPALVIRAILAGEYNEDEALLKAWEDWQPHMHKDPPPTVPIWMDDYLIDDCVKRAKARGQRPPAIVWYQHRHVAERLAARGLDWYDPEDGRNPELADPADGPIVLSIDSHVEGLNMQKLWHRNLILCPPSGGGTWEQLAGRTHRSGQEADTVLFEIYAHVPQYVDAIKNAVRLARFIEETAGAQQKLLIADWVTPLAA